MRGDGRGARLPSFGRTALGVVAVAGAAAVVAPWIGSRREDRVTARAAAALMNASPVAAPDVVDFGALAGLPPPVARYLRRSLTEGQRIIRAARFTQSGELRASENSDAWSRFDARQTVVPGAPGFVWDAKVVVAPLIYVRVRDAYDGAIASGAVSLLSAIRIENDHGTPELNAGALYRYLAECPWYPTALLPAAGVRWTPVDDRRAVATLTTSGTTVAVEFRFNDVDEIAGMYATGRSRRVDGRYEPTPWEGHFRRYEERDGMRVPIEGIVGWHMAGAGWRPVWRGAITSISYEFTR